MTGYDAVDGDTVPQYVNNHYQHGHGTCCAGIAAAITNNDEGVAGIAGGWGISGGCRIMPIRIGFPWVSDDDIKYCLEWAANHGAKVLSNSWNNPGYRYSDAIHSGISYAYNHGSLVLFSSGNITSADPYKYVHYPAADVFSIAVGATNQNDLRCSYSCYGHNLDLTAPSGDVGLSGIYTTDIRGGDGYAPGNYYSNFTVTSAACPHVAGLAGLLFSVNPDLANYDVERIIKIFAKDLGASGWDTLYGYGRIDAGKSVKHLILPYELTKGTAPAPILVESNVWRTFVNRPRPEMPIIDMYLCDVYKVEHTIYFTTPYAEPPWGWFSFTGYSYANPNNCTEFLYHSSSTTSLTLRTYFYQVKLGTYAGKWLPADPYLYATKYTILGRRPINTPTNLQATEIPFSNHIRVTWQDNSHNELKFKIYRSTGGDYFLYDSVGQNITQYIDVNTTPGQWYAYFVRAWAQEFFSGRSNIDWAVAGLAAPTELFINPVVYSGVQLYWADNSAIEDGYKVEKKVGTGDYTVVYTAGPNETSYLGGHYAKSVPEIFLISANCPLTFFFLHIIYHRSQRLKRG